jgi:hypothetical protein
MIAEINHKELTLLRLHSGGDFYDVEYIDKWLEIVQACPATTFYTYTRSWRDAEMLVALRRLAAQPNVHLWWSTDAETESIDGRPPAVDGVRVAHLILDDSEFDSVPDHADLVFRNKRSTKKTRVNGVLVCPCENGVKTTPRMHCDRCMVCYRTRATKRAGTESVTV